MKKTIFSLLLFFGGLAAGLVLIEAALSVLRGHPRKALFSDKSAYYHYEIYRPFFRKTRDAGGKTVYVTQRSRSPRVTFPAEKQPGTRRIFILGESTAQTFGRSREKLGAAFAQQIPGASFEVIPCGASAYDGSRIMLIAREILDYSPDLILLFMGNNPQQPVAYAPWLAKRSFRMLYEQSWTMRTVFDGYLRKRQDEPLPDRERDTKLFRNSYEEIVRAARRRGVPVVLVKLTGNFRDFPTKDASNLFANEDFMAARRALERDNPSKAASILSRMKDTALYNATPAIYFFLGKALDRRGDYTLARDNYLKAVSLDHGSYRCTPERNAIIDALAAQYDCITVDLPKLFGKLSPHGLVGDNIFVDHCHWFDYYNDLIIDEIVRQVYNFNRARDGAALAPLSGWRYSEKSFARAAEANKRAAAANAAQKQVFICAGITYALQAQPETAIYWFTRVHSLDRALLEAVNAERPGIKKIAEQNQFTGQLLRNSDARWYAVLACLGETLRRHGDYDRARICLDGSLKARPDQLYAHLFRGMLEYDQKRFDAARRDWEFVRDKNEAYSWLLKL